MTAHTQPLPNFGDAIDPTLIPFSHATLYGQDCEYPCPADVSIQFPSSNRRWITQQGHPESLIADYEPHTTVYNQPSRLREWHSLRRAFHRRCVVYVDRANASQAVADLNHSVHVLYWIATLDGKEQTAEELAVDLAANYNADISATQIWAQQVETVKDDSGNALYDRSILFRDW
jgi:hypothetical protein